MNYLRSKFGFFRRPLYQKVDNESLLSTKDEPENKYKDSETDSEELVRTLEFSHGKHQVLLKLALLFFMTLSILLAGAYITKKPSDRDCGIQTGVYSPANEAVEYEEIDFVNPFAHDTVYRGPPTPKLEKAWEELWFYGGVRITDDKLRLLNRTADLGNGRHLKPVEDEEGGYHALIEVFHQLHCLNLIRQYTWRDWYLRHEDVVKTPGDLRTDPVGSRMHVDHCIEGLRISLMCHGDTTPYFVMTDPTAPQGMRADFSPHHKCRNFEKIRDWTKENQLAPPPPMHWEGNTNNGHSHGS